MMRAASAKTVLPPVACALAALCLGIGAAAAPSLPALAGARNVPTQPPAQVQPSSQSPQRGALPEAPRPPRSALAKAPPPEVAEWIRTIAGRPLNAAEAAALLRDWGVDADAEPAYRDALDAAMAGFRARWDAFSNAELIPLSERRGTSLADLATDAAQSASFIVDLRSRRHALEDAMLDEFGRALPEAMRTRVELAKAARGSQVPGWAAGSLVPAGTTAPLMSIAWQASYVPEQRREEVRLLAEPALAPHAAKRARAMDGLLRAALESDLMADQVAVEVQEAARKVRDSGSAVDGKAVLAIAMSRQLLPIMCAAGDVQASNARMLDSLKGALQPQDFAALLQAYARAASVPLSPQVDPDAALSNAREDGAIAGAQLQALAAIADAWRSDDAALLMSWVQSLPEFSRSMCSSLGEIRWDDPPLPNAQPVQSDALVRVQQRQMQLLQARTDRATAAVAAMRSQLTPEEWERIKPTRPVMRGAPEASTP